MTKRSIVQSLALVLTATLGFVGISALSACHTVEGAGRDVQAIGGGVEDTAAHTREEYIERH